MLINDVVTKHVTEVTFTLLKRQDVYEKRLRRVKVVFAVNKLSHLKGDIFVEALGDKRVTKQVGEDTTLMAARVEEG